MKEDQSSAALSAQFELASQPSAPSMSQRRKALKSAVAPSSQSNLALSNVENWLKKEAASSRPSISECPSRPSFSVCASTAKSERSCASASRVCSVKDLVASARSRKNSLSSRPCQNSQPQLASERAASVNRLPSQRPKSVTAVSDFISQARSKQRAYSIQHNQNLQSRPPSEQASAAPSITFDVFNITPKQVVHRAQGHAGIIRQYLERLDQKIDMKDKYEKAVIDELNHG